MREGLRKSGIDIIGDVHWGMHFCQFYKTEEDLMEILVPYFKEGLENNEFCLWAMTQPMEVEEAKEALKKAIPDLDTYLQKGQIEIAPYPIPHPDGFTTEEVFDSKITLSDWVEKFNHGLDSGYDGLRFVGSIFWLGEEKRNCLVEYEKQIDNVLDNYQMIALCTYSLNECNATKIIDVFTNHQFALVKKEGEWEQVENSGREKIIEYKREDKAMSQSEQLIRLKLETTLSPALETASLEFSEIVDIQAIQSLMDDFYELTHIPMGLNDVKGNVLASSGWQDICTKFHRFHPEACKHCVESNIKLSVGVAPGEFKLFKCKNNMWDIATPIMIRGHQVGILFAGQFFFEDEPLDYELFKSQARKYGFDEEEYIVALEKVPRLSRETVNRGMAFLTKLANMISQLSYSNVKLAQSLVERDALVEALQRERSLLDSVMQATDVMLVFLDPQFNFVWVNPTYAETCHMKPEEMVGKNHFALYPHDENEAIFRQVRDTGEGVFYKDKPFAFPDQPERGVTYWDWSLEPVKDSSENVAGLVFSLRETTKYKQAEEALRLSNIYNRSLIEASLDPLVTIGRDGKIKDVNCATENVTGYSRNELIGTDFSDYFTEPEKAHKGYQRVFTDSEIRDYPLEIQNKHGHITPVLYNASVYRDENGEVIGVFADARDISELKKAEEALKKAHDNLEKLVEERTTQLEKAYNSLKESEEGLSEAQKIAHVGNWEWDIAIGKTYWSDELYRIFGLNPQESTPTSDEFFAHIHPDDREYVVNAIEAALKGKPYGGIDYRIILANGEERIVNAKSEIVYDEENIPIRVKGIVQDITGRKKTEEKIQTLANAVESSNDAIVTESLSGVITSWNKGAEQIYGYSVEDIMGKDVSILEPANLKGEIKQLTDKIKQGERVEHYETLRLKKDGTLIYVSITLSPIFDASSKLVAISAISRDITQRRMAEEALRESETRLRRFYESGMFGVVYYNLDGSIFDANDKFLDIVGYTREDLQAGLINWHKITPPEYRQLDDRCIAELKAFGVYKPYEKEYIRKDCSHVPIILGAATFDRERNEGIAFVLDNTEIKRTEKALAEMDKIRIKEIHHRIKNNLQVISSLLDLQAEKFQDKEVLEAFRESQNRVVSMSLIHEELYKGEGTDTLDFSAYLRKLAENIFQTYTFCGKNVYLYMDLEEKAFFDMDTAVPLGIIVNELVSNSLKHAFVENQEGEIRIRLCREGKNNEIHKSLFNLTISDNGKGIPENAELEGLESLGLQLVNILVDQMDGEIGLKREQGTEFRISFKVIEKDH